MRRSLAEARPARFLFLLGLFLLLPACNPTGQTAQNAQSFFPLELGARWIYESTFYGPQTRTTTTTVAVCRLRPEAYGRVYMLATCGDDPVTGERNIFIQTDLMFPNGAEIVQPVGMTRDGAARSRDPPEVITRTDLRVGQLWQWEGTLAGEQRRSLYRVVGRGQVLTPAGQYDATRLLVWEGTETPSAAVERWYARGVGLVREAGAIYLPLEGGMAQLEIVRLLREHDVIPVDTIPCCGRIPG